MSKNISKNKNVSKNKNSSKINNLFFTLSYVKWSTNIIIVKKNYKITYKTLQKQVYKKGKELLGKNIEMQSYLYKIIGSSVKLVRSVFLCSKMHLFQNKMNEQIN